MGKKDPIRPAAIAIVVTQDRAVLVGDRHPDLPFLGGYVAFPGGRIEPEDVDRAERLWGQTDDVATAKAAALRELHEETQLLFENGQPVLRPDVSFDRALDENRIAIDIDRLVPVRRVVTPESSPIRFDARFFGIQIESSLPVQVDDREFTRAGFEPVHDLLHQHRHRQRFISSPTVQILQTLTAGFDALRLGPITQNAWEDPELALRDAHHMPFEPIAGIRQLPLRTPTLPPAEHTNTYIVGDERLIVIDPATYDRQERERLLFHIEALTQRGALVDAIVLTHHHPDHMGSAQWLRARLGVEVKAHLHTRDLLRGKVTVDTLLSEGDIIDLGADATGAPFRLEVLHTPGHAPGHIVLQDKRTDAHALIVGDMVAAIGTIVIDPPEGDMGQYLQQLERLRNLDDQSVLFPAHGPPVLNGPGKFDHYLAHRRNRETKVMTALRTLGPATPHELLPLAYDDTPPPLYPLAARACLAHLIKLVQDGQVVREDTSFRALTKTPPNV